MVALGGDPAAINPQIPAELVIDHSVQVDEFGSRFAIFKNNEREFERNRERYAFLRWGQTAFDNFSVVPPNTGIVHQVNLEYLARVVEAREEGGRLFAFPDAPTLKELGYTAEYYAWSGFVAPAGTPQAVVDRINKSANLALAEPDVIKILTANGFEVVGGKPEIFAKAMSSYIRDVSEIGRKNNLEID